MKISSKKIALTALLTATAILLGVVESLIPPIFPALPFLRLGLGNVAVGFSAIALGCPYAVLTALLKGALVGLIAGNPMMIIYSLAGGVTSAVVTILLINLRKLSLPVIGVLSACVHNLMQLFVAAAMTSTAEVFTLAPVFLVFGAVAGFGTGTVQFLVIRALPERFFSF